MDIDLGCICRKGDYIEVAVALPDGNVTQSSKPCTGRNTFNLQDFWQCQRLTQIQDRLLCYRGRRVQGQVDKFTTKSAGDTALAGPSSALFLCSTARGAR